MILSTIQEVVADLTTPCAFFYANLYEANGELGIPEFSEGKDTFFVYIPPFEVVDTVDMNGLIHTVFTMQFFLMRRLELPTTDYRSQDIDPVMDEMRTLARQFIHKLEEQDIVEKGGPAEGITERKITSEYGWVDHHLFGVSCTCEVPLMQGLTGCI